MDSDGLILKPMSEVTDEELERMRVRNQRDLREADILPSEIVKVFDSVLKDIVKDKPDGYLY